MQNTLRDDRRLARIRWSELFRSKIDAHVGWSRWDLVSLFISCLIVGWVFAIKLQAFHQLSYSGDLFLSVQAARSWLEGKGLLQDNCFGNVLVPTTRSSPTPRTFAFWGSMG